MGTSANPALVLRLPDSGTNPAAFALRVRVKHRPPGSWGMHNGWHPLPWLLSLQVALCGAPPPPRAHGPAPATNLLLHVCPQVLSFSVPGEPASRGHVTRRPPCSALRGGGLRSPTLCPGACTLPQPRRLYPVPCDTGRREGLGTGLLSRQRKGLVSCLKIELLCEEKFLYSLLLAQRIPMSIPLQGHWFRVVVKT